ncbi:hypothetical protein GCM10009640_07160 [Agrococcus citreus]|uniref:AP2-like integrase N-terminal domain-containing protein n=1 Tax=Agrococcus citreus TaxID=84643 RepID=A0ABN1YRG3_9MICO
MARRRTPLGTFGAIRCYETKDGRWKARGRFRELSGKYSSPSAIGDTPEEAEDLLRARKAIQPFGVSSVDPNTSEPSPVLCRSYAGASTGWDGVSR